MKKTLKKIGIPVLWAFGIALGLFILIGHISTFGAALDGYYASYQEEPSFLLSYYPAVQFLFTLFISMWLTITSARKFYENIGNIGQKIVLLLIVASLYAFLLIKYFPITFSPPAAAVISFLKIAGVIFALPVVYLLCAFFAFALLRREGKTVTYRKVVRESLKAIFSKETRKEKSDEPG